MTPEKTCAYCGGPAEGNYSIHRDGFGVGPEVDLCDAHGGGELPSCEQIWDRIAQARTAMIDPNKLHCRGDGRYCRGETFCACQCDQCRAAWEAGRDWYEARRQKKTEDGDGR